MLMTDPERAFETKRQDVLALGCEHVGFDVGLLARLTDTTADIDEVHAPGVAPLSGTTIDLPAPAEPVDLSAMVQAELDRVAKTDPGVTVERELPDGGG